MERNNHTHHQSPIANNQQQNAVLLKRAFNIAWPLRRFALIALVCLPAVWPLFTAPFFASDDGLFHLYRLAALDDAIRQGIWYPRIFPSFAFGYGQAILSYYGPLVYYIAEMFHLLGADFPLAIKLTFACGYVASGWTMYALARQYVQPVPALVAAVAYVYFPYHLAETYQRGALAEHWAFVWLPLMLFQISDFRFQICSRRALVVIFSLSALLLTHSLTALIFLPFVIIYHMLISNRQSSNIQFQSSMLKHRFAVFNLLLALALTACYWLPIATQSRWVGLSAGLDNDGYRFHLAPLLSFVQPALVFQYAPHQIVAADHPLSLWSFISLLVSLLMVIGLWRRRDGLAWPLTFFVSLTLIALFMASEPSIFVWQWLHNPLTFLQYPWRFMTLVALGLAMCLALVIEKMGHRDTGTQGALLRSFPVSLFTCILVSFILVTTATTALPMRPLAAAPSDTQTMWQNDYQQKQIGATWTAEYVPGWVRADRTAIPTARRAPLSDVEASLSVPRVTLLVTGYTLRRYQLEPTTNESVLRFHQFYLPPWRVTLDGQSLATFPSTDLGLLSVTLPPITKEVTLEIDFGFTNLERMAIIISSISLLIIVWRFGGRWGLSLIAVSLLLAFVTSLNLPIAQSLNLPIPQSLNPPITQLEDFTDLIGVSIPSDTYHAGDAVPVTLTWLVRREIGTSENFKGFVHLMSADGTRVVAQSDSDPVGGFTPTSQWRVGEIIEDTRLLRIPSDAPIGTLLLFTGLYRTQPLKNLSATQTPDGRIPIGVLNVRD
jgi:hypothetical protein